MITILKISNLFIISNENYCENSLTNVSCKEDIKVFKYLLQNCIYIIYYLKLCVCVCVCVSVCMCVYECTCMYV